MIFKIIFQELPTLEDSTTSIMGSESNIYNMKLPTGSTDLPHSLKSHNSDSEILRLNDDETQAKVVFTLGEESTIDLAEKLVRISTNNQDEISLKLDENVKQICSEIKDFCSSDLAEGVDIVKHIDKNVEEINIAKYMERKVSGEIASDVNDVQSDSDVAVTDVIVIPSAEAILDTGQDVSQIEDAEK